MGDVIHTLPALTDAAKRLGDISFDWVVEESFQEIPAMHPNVDKVVTVNIRRWRKNIWRYRGEIKACIKRLKASKYDCVIDAQGLIKSAWLTHYIKAPRFGLDKLSAKEALSSWAYTNKINVPKDLHAIERVRQLFSKSLGYSLNKLELDYGLDNKKEYYNRALNQPYVVFLHGTTWASKHWPDRYWQQLVRLAVSESYHVYLPWGNKQEHERASRLAEEHKNVHVLEKSSLKQLASTLMYAEGVVGVDSGLAHLTAACNTPSVSLYGSTNAKLTATKGVNNLALQTDFACSPCMKKVCDYPGKSEVQPACYQTLPPQYVFNALLSLIL